MHTYCFPSWLVVEQIFGHPLCFPRSLLQYSHQMLLSALATECMLYKVEQEVTQQHGAALVSWYVASPTVAALAVMLSSMISNVMAGLKETFSDQQLSPASCPSVVLISRVACITLSSGLQFKIYFRSQQGNHGNSANERTLASVHHLIEYRTTVLKMFKPCAETNKRNKKGATQQQKNTCDWMVINLRHESKSDGKQPEHNEEYMCSLLKNRLQKFSLCYNYYQVILNSDTNNPNTIVSAKLSQPPRNKM